ncbi:MAG: rRNA maturation RNase YbeY [Phycisphaeraceae bacterium]|nr:rRNA maturation RNase YbeY [Phycisphaeraceae bacterium]
MPRAHSNRRPPSPRDGSLTVTLTLQTSDVQPPLRRWLSSKLRQVAEHVGLRRGRVNLLILDDAAMSDLHRRYKHMAGPTDVLSFDLRETPKDELEADIAICLDEAVRQAARRGHETRREALLYAVHGLLHLLGEDDHEPAARRRMHQREDQLLAAIGVGSTFARGETAP